MKIMPTSADDLLAQFSLLTSDIETVAACKIGLIPSVDVLAAVVAIVKQLPPNTPIVLDPVMASGSGFSMVDDAVRTVLAKELWPLCTVCTPNMREARILCGSDDIDAIAEFIRPLSLWTLIKGADEETPSVMHTLYLNGIRYASYRWPRLSGSYHGSGCTLASAIASFLARGATTAVAIGNALSYTWQSLATPIDISARQLLPNRLFR